MDQIAKNVDQIAKNKEATSALEQQISDMYDLILELSAEQGDMKKDINKELREIKRRLEMKLRL